MTLFGDIERADCFDADPTIAPEQVAYFIHRLRQRVEALAGHELGRWRTLSRRDQDAALLIADRLVDEVEAGNRNPATIASAVVGLRWPDLTGPERQIAIDIVDLVLDWLAKERDL